MIFNFQKNETKKICNCGSEIINEIANINLNTNEVYNNPISCIKCGSPMVLRNGPSGQFYGCSRYPLCKSTMSCKAGKREASKIWINQ